MRRHRASHVRSHSSPTNPRGFRRDSASNDSAIPGRRSKISCDRRRAVSFQALARRDGPSERRGGGADHAPSLAQPIFAITSARRNWRCDSIGWPHMDGGETLTRRYVTIPVSSPYAPVTQGPRVPSMPQAHELRDLSLTVKSGHQQAIRSEKKLIAVQERLSTRRVRYPWLPL